VALWIDDDGRDAQKLLAGARCGLEVRPAGKLQHRDAVDFVDDETGRGFQIDNPAARPTWNDPIAQKVQKVIDDTLGPALAQHGGWVELVTVEGDCAHVELGGGCQGGAGARATLKNGIESVIVRDVPEIKRVVDDTDHGAGATPYPGPG